MRRLYWLLWTRPRISYGLDRAFGWSRQRAFLRCWGIGRQYLSPSDGRRQSCSEAQNQAQVDYDAQKTQLFRDLQAIRDKALEGK